jgi:very-short-patch-repair endonuclease
MPVTAVLLTILDLAATARPGELELALAEAERRRLLRIGRLREALERSPRRGNARLRSVLERTAGPALTRSEAERLLLRLVRAAGLPPPEHNVRVGGHELDLLWREQRLVVEVDGYAYHSGRAAFERDRVRDAELLASGFRVLRLTWRRLVEEPESVVARLAQALAGVR